MASKKPLWKPGDIFCVELEDGREVLGQVLGRETDALNSAICAFTLLTRTDGNPRVTADDYISVQFVTSDNLDRKRWKILAHGPAPAPEEYFDIPSARRLGFVGTKVRGSGVMRKFLDACFGLRYWDSFVDPVYFDKLLLPGIARPTTARLGNQS